MKRKLKNKLIVLLLALLSLFVLGGCTLTEGLDDVLADRNLEAQVTYYANGGAFGNNVKEKNLYYPADVKAIDITNTNITSGSIKLERTGYELVGWYFVDMDGQGNPIYEDEEAGIYKLAEKVDFSESLQKGDHWIIAAKWRALVGVKVVMVCDEGATVEVGEGKDDMTAGATSFGNGDEIGELNYNSKGLVNLASAQSEPDSKFFTVKDRAFTFLDYYMDAECQTPAPDTITRGETDVTIYAKYVEGDWNRITDARGVSEMLSGVKDGKNYWIMNDIDCSVYGVINPSTETNGMIQGNGYTISNMKLGKSLVAADLQVAMFGKIGASAKIENITFENVTMSYTTKTTMYPEIYGVFVSLAEGATVSNVHISGTLSFDGPGDSAASNMAEGYNHCLFGGYASDEAYTGGFSVTLTVDGNEVGNANS